MCACKTVVVAAPLGPWPLAVADGRVANWPSAAFPTHSFGHGHVQQHRPAPNCAGISVGHGAIGELAGKGPVVVAVVVGQLLLEVAVFHGYLCPPILSAMCQECCVRTAKKVGARPTALALVVVVGCFLCPFGHAAP